MNKSTDLRIKRRISEGFGVSRHGFQQTIKRILIPRKDQYDRLIVISDEQAHDAVPGPKGNGYVINVASYKNGVGYGKWTHIDCWSESVVEYIRTLEQAPNKWLCAGASGYCPRASSSVS
jgi:hypothetical protein